MGFWPNAAGDTHHRSDEFHRTYRSVQDILRTIFDLDSRTWDILLIPLSGSLTIESVIRTFGGIADVRTSGAFSDRVGEVHHSPSAPWTFGVQYETNDSRRCEVADCDIVDAVSSLPYFPFPRHARAVITVSSKQLGGSTVWSVVFLRREFWQQVDPLPGYLDLRRYQQFERLAETPCTPPIEGLFTLQERLEQFDLPSFRQRIDQRHRLATQVITSIGGEVDGSPPVLTFRLPAGVEVAEESLWVPHGRSGWLQAFLWSGSDAEFDVWIESIQAIDTDRLQQIC